jgi:hypothetical protein
MSSSKATENKVEVHNTKKMRRVCSPKKEREGFVPVSLTCSNVIA